MGFEKKMQVFKPMEGKRASFLEGKQSRNMCVGRLKGGRIGQTLPHPSCMGYKKKEGKKEGLAIPMGKGRERQRHSGQSSSYRVGRRQRTGSNF